MIQSILSFYLSAGNMDASEIPDRTNVTRVANLLGVNDKELAGALTSKTIFARGDTIVNMIYNFSSIFIVL